MTIQIPPLSANNTDFGKLKKSSNDSSNQTGGYLGSNGWKYYRYSTNGIGKTLEDWLSYFQIGNVGSTPFQ